MIRGIESKEFFSDSRGNNIMKQYTILVNN